MISKEFLGFLVIFLIFLVSAFVCYKALKSGGIYQYLAFLLPFIPLSALFVFPQMEMFERLPFFIKDLELLFLVTLAFIPSYLIIKALSFLDTERWLFSIYMFLSFMMPPIFLIFLLPMLLPKFPLYDPEAYLSIDQIRRIKDMAGLILPGLPFLFSLYMTFRLYKIKHLARGSYLAYTWAMSFQLLWFGGLPLLGGALVGV